MFQVFSVSTVLGWLSPLGGPGVIVVPVVVSRPWLQLLVP